VIARLTGTPVARTADGLVLDVNGVGYLLRGSVRRGGGRVRVTAALVRADGQTQLWADSYERPLTDVLRIQREIAEKIGSDSENGTFEFTP